MSSTQKEIKFIFLMSLFMLIIAMLPHYPETEASAGSTYFGGKVSSMTICTCNKDGGSKVVLQGPGGSSGTYLYVPSKKTYTNHLVKSGNNLIGKYTPGGVCQMLAYPKCKIEPISKGTIDYVGTSF